MSPSRLHRRHLAVPAIGLASLLAVPLAARAESGSGSNGSTTEASSTTAPVVTAPVTTAPVTTAPLPSDPPTTLAPTTVPAAPSTTIGGRGKDVLKFLSDLATMLEKAKISADVRNALLPQVRAMRDAVAAGALPTQADLQALSAQVMAAVRSVPSRPSSTTAPAAPSTTVAKPSESTTSIPRSNQGAGSGDRAAESAKVTAQLDEWVTKIGASSISDADKATLLAAIERVRALAVGGTFKTSDLATLRTMVRSAFERTSGGSGSSTSAAAVPSVPGSTSGATPESAPGSTDGIEPDGADDAGPRTRGKPAVDAAIAAVTNSPLPDGVKQDILDVLGRAKAILEDGSLAPDEAAQQLRELCDAQQAKRISEAAAKLTTFSQKIALLAFNNGATPGATEVIVQVHDLLAQANDILASPELDISRLKDAWKLLHQARTTLQQFLEASSGATTTTSVEAVVPN